MVKDGKGAGAKGSADVAAVVAVGAGAPDDDGGRWRVEAGKEVEDAATARLGIGRAAVEGNLKIDDGDVDGVALDNVAGLGSRSGPERGNAKGFKESRDGLGPRIPLPPAIGEQEVETSAGRRLGCKGALHHGSLYARCVPCVGVCWRVWGRFQWVGGPAGG